MKEECGSCKFWKTYDQEDLQIGKNMGRCERFPPVRVASASPEFIQEEWENWSQPDTLSDTWCGEFSKSTFPPTDL